MRKHNAVTLLLVACFLAVLPVAALAQRDDEDELEIPNDAVPALFVDVIDGDTIIVEIEDEGGETVEETVRMIGIDTPETNYSFGNQPECYGDEATKKTESLLVAADGEIWLESDVSDRDQFDRLLRYVWYISEIDDEVHLLNEDLVREGYALARAYRPDTARQDELDAAERAAITNAAGLWLTCDASVSMDPDLEHEDGPDDVPIDRTKVPAEVEEDAACSFFDYFEQAQEFLAEYPELADILDPDFDGVACEDYFDVGSD
ncbi:MAG: thermonuclease family protein [Thermomicrobiales bacterium]